MSFCNEMSQSQTANQWARTTKNATALADGNAQAHNVGSVVQQVWQLRFGCEMFGFGAAMLRKTHPRRPVI